MTRTRLFCLIACSIVTAMIAGATWTSWGGSRTLTPPQFEVVAASWSSAGRSDSLTPTEFVDICWEPWDICSESWSPSCNPWDNPTCEYCDFYCKGACDRYASSASSCWSPQDLQMCYLCCATHYSFCVGVGE